VARLVSVSPRAGSNGRKLTISSLCFTPSGGERFTKGLTLLLVVRDVPPLLDGFSVAIATWLRGDVYWFRF